MRRHTLLYPLLLFGFFFLLSSCDKEGPDPEIPFDIPETNGFYIFGTNTIAEEPTDPGSKMPPAILDPTKSSGKEEDENVLGRLMYIGVKSIIQVVEVEDGTAVLYGLPGGGTLKPGSQVSFTNISSEMIQGTMIPDEEPVTITNEGLYYVLILKDTKEIRILELEPEIIGDATEGGWSTGTKIPLKSINDDAAVFEITELPLRGSSKYKFRFSRGWEIYTSVSSATQTNLGVESYDEARASGLNEVGYHTDSCAQLLDGNYTLTLSYDLFTEEWSEHKEFIRDLSINYSDTEMGLFGNAYLVAPGDTASWRPGFDGYELHTPIKEGNVYTWNWTNVKLLKGREFIFLEDGTWGGLEISFSIADVVTGQSVEDGHIVDAATVGKEFNDFHVVEQGNYDISLEIDNNQNITTVSITDSF